VTTPKASRKRRSTNNNSSRAFSSGPSIRALLDEGRAGPAMSADELDLRLGTLTSVEKARAEAHLRALEQLEADQEAEVTAEQDRAIELVLAAAEYAREETPLAKLAADSGLPEPIIRAAAMALKCAFLRR
jgi:hypothetical protein